MFTGRHMTLLAVWAITLTSSPVGVSADTLPCVLSNGAYSYCISEYDPADYLGNRTPIVLIHGWQYDSLKEPAPDPRDYWNGFLTFFDNDPSLKDIYKIYFFTYMSNDLRASDIGAALGTALDIKNIWDPAFANRSLVFVAHSLGGLVARSFMEQYRQQHGAFANTLGGERVQKLLTLGTMHHGTPLANGASMADLLSVNDPVAHTDFNLVRWVVFDRKGLTSAVPNRSDMKWDNLIPPYLDYSAYPEEANHWLSDQLNALTLYDPKIVAYAGVFTSASGCFPFFSELVPCAGSAILGAIGLASDGLVPDTSALFQGHNVGGTRYFSGYDHDQILNGKGDNLLFERIKLDIAPVTWLQSPPRPPSSVISGTSFSISWQIAGGANFGHTNVHLDTIPNLTPASCLSRPSCQTTSFQAASNTTFAAQVLAPTVAVPTIYYVAIHAEVDGFDAFSSIVPVAVVPQAAPVMSITPSSRDFGSLSIGTSRNLTFTITNSGGSTLSGFASTQSPFSIPSPSYSIPAGHSADISVRYAPTTHGSFRANVNFTGGGGATTLVQGTGVPSDAAPPQAPIALTATPSDWSVDRFFTITWTNPSDTSGISKVWYKVGSPPTSASDGIWLSVPQFKPFLAAATVQGGQPIHVWLEDAAGNKNHNNRSSTTLYYDAISPTGSVTVNGGATTTTALSGTLSLAASDGMSGMGFGAEMRFSNDGTAWSLPEPYSPTRPNWNLAEFGGDANPGNKTVSAQFKDVAGNWSAPTSVSIAYSSATSRATVTTNPASAVTSSRANLNLTVNPNGLPTAVWFYWGPTTDYGYVTDTRAVGSGTSALQISEPLPGLQPNTTYHYRAFAQSDAGMVSGADLSFATPAVTPTPLICMSTNSLSFSEIQGGPNPPPQEMYIANCGQGTLNWSVSADRAWISLDPTSGSATGENDSVAVRTDITGLAAGAYNGTITITDPSAGNTPRTIPVALEVRAPGTWDTTIIDTANDRNEATGYGSSLALDPDRNVHISYKFYSGGVWYATDATGAWDNERLDSAGSATLDNMTSLAIDSAGKAHIAYRSNDGLAYVTDKSGQWVITIVDDATNVGDYASLALDASGHVHIVYWDATNFDLKYATNAPGAWTTATIDSSGEVGTGASLAVDGNGKVHVSYFDRWPSFDLKYATNATGPWTTQVADGNILVSYGKSFSSLGVDVNGKVHISYRDLSDFSLKYATNSSGAWSAVSIAAAGPIDESTSLALDGSGKVHIAFHDRTSADLKYLTNISGTWQVTTIDHAASGSQPSLVIDSLGKLHVSYLGQVGTSQALKYATNAANTIKSFALSVQKTGDGRGAIVSQPAGLSCGAACRAPFALNTLVTLTPTAESNSSFTGWSGACAGSGSCAVTANAVKSVTAAFATQPDATPAWSQIGSPTGGQPIGGTTLTISGTAGDDMAVSQVEVSTDGGTSWTSATCAGCPGPTVTWSYSWTLPSTGTYLLKSRAIDSSNHIELPGAGVSVRVDRTAPVSSVASPMSNTLVTTASLNPFTISGTSSDVGGASVAGVAVSTDGGTTWAPATNTGTNFSTWSFSWTLPADGAYNIKTRATDTATGTPNIETPGSGLTVTVDRTRPAVSSSSPAHGATGVALNAPVTITWNENVNCESATASTIAISGGGWSKQSCSGNQAIFVTSSQTRGTTYTVTAGPNVRDLGGNAMAASYSFTYTTLPDTSAPVAGTLVATKRYGSFVGSPFDLSAPFTDNDSDVISCEYTTNGTIWQPAIVAGNRPNFTCTKTGITGPHNTQLSLNMRATSRGGTRQGTALSLKVDLLAPTGTIKVNGTASYTNSANVTLALTSSDPNGSGIAEMCVSNTSSCSAWEPFKTSRAWTLPSGDGTKSVFAWFKDRVGNETASSASDRIGLDTVAPTNPTSLTSSSHTPSMWSKDRTIDAAWSGASDNGSGVNGYSISWNTTATSLPDTTVDTTSTASTSPSLPDGKSHYAHLRTRDNAGNWNSNAIHLGPFWIDGTPPVNGTLTATPGVGQVSLSWSGFSDPMSGLAAADRYKLVFSIGSLPQASCTTGTQILLGSGTTFVHQGLNAGTTYYYRLCASDSAGNVSSGATKNAIAQ